MGEAGGPVAAGDRIVEILRAGLPGLEFAYLFGSRADGSERPESDYDLAFRAREALDPVALFGLRSKLEAELDADVDLVDLRAADDVIKVQIVGTGVVLYNADRTALDEFEMYALSDYARLNEARAGILEDYYGKDVID